MLVWKRTIKRVLGLFIFLFAPILGFTCHNTGITEVSAVDNGDGTFTYELQIVLGGNSADSEAFGFWIDLTGGGSLVKW
jgi:hypothetical protein